MKTIIINAVWNIYNITSDSNGERVDFRYLPRVLQST